jgi:hypothetical protein
MMLKFLDSHILAVFICEEALREEIPNLLDSEGKISTDSSLIKIVSDYTYESPETIVNKYDLAYIEKCVKEIRGHLLKQCPELRGAVDLSPNEARNISKEYLKKTIFGQATMIF